LLYNSPTWEVEFGMDASAGLISLAYYNYFMRSFTAPELANLVDPTSQLI